MSSLQEVYRRLPEISARKFNLLFVTALLLIYNGSLWEKMASVLLPDNGFMLLPYFVAFFALFYFFVSLITLRTIYRPALVLIVFSASFVSYFMTEYGILIDKIMIQNTFETDVGEALELLNRNLVWYFLITGLVPAALIYLVKLKPLSYSRQLRNIIVDAGLSFCLLLVVLAVFYKSFSMVFRENGDIRFRLTPSNYIYYSVRYLSGAYEQTRQPLQTIMPDASMPRLADIKTVTVLVIGETARAQNFSLNGYARSTNARLKNYDIVNYSKVSSCGTTTAISLPCMFSDQTRSSYKSSQHGHRENVLDVLQRLGVGSIWRDNNSGCKGVCDRLTTADIVDFKLTEACSDKSCYDEAMLEGLGALMNSPGQHKIIVLHQLGSHGPAYYKRYPKQFEIFTPACQLANVAECEQQHIINAYDNTIAYTDHFLAQIIDRLKREDSIASSMIYVSDHGESLGENGAYLHGLPYFMAPSQQTQVPMLMWFSASYQTAFNINKRCLLDRRGHEYSHDNLFHSLLGLYGVNSESYRASLDIFSPCRTT